MGGTDLFSGPTVSLFGLFSAFIMYGGWHILTLLISSVLFLFSCLHLLIIHQSSPCATLAGKHPAPSAASKRVFSLRRVCPLSHTVLFHSASDLRSFDVVSFVRN